QPQADQLTSPQLCIVIQNQKPPERKKENIRTKSSACALVFYNTRFSATIVDKWPPSHSKISHKAKKSQTSLGLFFPNKSSVKVCPHCR
ncbi:MAG: hypothetical protein OXT67_04860, partial [Zetaproteobacteria bacterium]|nr:hypothetical protein [Zetaproteobacteria bacterium]